ncbi:MAG: bifunctional histidinol-phosphatase/imidazoleglycerol-phosphate dehydratase HisB [Chlorobi bacterium]|nr:bifunctional histidinol-phosphatase/imidazoleglycerol-phosphate dehydratase HisB [Chlorobiota bacterium]
MKKILFIDRDGTLVKEPDDYQLDDFGKLEFYPGAISWLARIADELDFLLVMVTNQDGLGTDSFPETEFWPVHNLILKTFENEGVTFENVIIDRTFPEDNAPTRKPGTDLLQDYMAGDYDLTGSFVIGDRITDVILAHNLGARAIWLDDGTAPGGNETVWNHENLKKAVVLKTTSWKDIYTFLRATGRQVTLSRKTHETMVNLTLSLSGTGKAEIRTGLGFFDHMLGQLAFHGGMDLTLDVKGDLQVDEHHTIEDTAITLGQAVRQVADHIPAINRYGFVVPMDDSVASVAVDMGGRSYLQWEVDFSRERIGDVPTEMFKHFFRSFADASGCTIRIEAAGENEHHKAEAVFKAFARALSGALALKENNHGISTKGAEQWQ